MPQPTRTPRQSLFGSVQGRKFSLGDVATKGKAVPNRYGLYAGQGFGKTSLLAYAPSPLFVLTQGETGLDTLINAKQLPETPHLPEITSWADLVEVPRFLRESDHKYKTLVLDTANGAVRLLHEYIVERDFEGDWGEKGFLSYNKGPQIALADWRVFLNDLDRLREEKSMTIFFLMHSQIKSFKNPIGADFDRYSPEMDKDCWTLTKGWLDCILFGNFEITVKQGGRTADSSRKGKASEVSVRMLYTNSENPTYEAKNRLGLPAEIEMGDAPQEGWTNFANALKQGREAKPGAAATATPATNEKEAVTNG